MKENSNYFRVMKSSSVTFFLNTFSLAKRAFLEGIRKASPGRFFGFLEVFAGFEGGLGMGSSVSEPLDAAGESQESFS